MSVKDLVKQNPTHEHQRGGLRGVVLSGYGNSCLSIVASPSASYLLPDLVPAREAFSRRGDETRRPGSILIVGKTIVIGRALLDEGEVAKWQTWTSSLSATGVEAGTQTVWQEGRAGRGDLSETAVESGLDRGFVIGDSSALLGEESRTTEQKEALPADAPVEEIASRAYELSGLGDETLAALFRVTRETFNRWRAGALTNPTPGNRRRLGVLLRLLEELNGREVNIKDWLQNPTMVDGLSPYELLRRGRIDKVAYLAAAVGSGYAARSGRDEMSDEKPLIFEDEEGWEAFEIEVDDDEG